MTLSKYVQTSHTQDNLPVSSEDEDIAKELEGLLQWGTPENSNTFTDNKISMPQASKLGEHTGCDLICPMCNIVYPSGTSFSEFESHVRSHFVADLTDNIDIEHMSELV